VKKLKDILATAFLLGSLILVGTLLVIGVYVHILHEGGVAEHTATVPQRATLVQQEQCSQDAKGLAASRIEIRMGSTASHFDTLTGRCLASVDVGVWAEPFIHHFLLDANENIQLADFDATGDGAVLACWVADLTGFHRGCNSLESYDALVKKYYGVTQ
jgi:hypothetical protein